jgi:hypothetical protein
LYQDNPNPFSSVTLITYGLEKTEQEILSVLNFSRSVIFVLVDENLDHGSYEVSGIDYLFI